MGPRGSDLGCCPIMPGPHDLGPFLFWQMWPHFTRSCLGLLVGTIAVALTYVASGGQATLDEPPPH